MFVKNLGCPVHNCIKRKFWGMPLCVFCIVNVLQLFDMDGLGEYFNVMIC